MTTPLHDAPPPLRHLLGEAWTGVHWLRSRAAWRSLVRQAPRGRGQPVLVLPGYLTSDASTRILRGALARLGYAVYAWEEGRNRGLSSALLQRLAARVAALHARHGQAVSLVGWSLGGIVAREVARQSPGDVRMVITLGSPFAGGPRSNHIATAWRLLRRGPRATAPRRDPGLLAAPLEVPTTCVYSRRDGIVAWQACMSARAPRTENIEVYCTHLGFGLDPGVLQVLADRLALADGAWSPWQAPR